VDALRVRFRSVGYGRDAIAEKMILRLENLGSILVLISIASMGDVANGPNGSRLAYSLIFPVQTQTKSVGLYWTNATHSNSHPIYATTHLIYATKNQRPHAEGGGCCHAWGR